MIEFINFHTIATFLTALALGGMVFFSFLVAPATFRVLGRDGAPPLISAFFQLYYPYVALTSAIAAALIFYRFEAILLAGVAVIAVFAYFVIRPAIEGLRARRLAGDAAASRKFGRLHGLSMVANLLQIGILCYVFFILIR